MVAVGRIMRVYIKVTRDKYRLPLAIADTAEELAKIVGRTPSVIYKSVQHGRGIYERVEIGELEDETD